MTATDPHVSPPAPARFARPQIALHWGIALLIILNWWLGDEMRPPRGAGAEAADWPSAGTYAHVIIGLTIMALVVWRLVLRMRLGVPPESPRTPGVLATAGKLSQWAFYVLMILGPIAGAVAWFGGVRPAGGLHETIINALMILFLLHAAAALFHQYVIKDRLLLRMMPGR